MSGPRSNVSTSSSSSSSSNTNNDARRSTASSGSASSRRRSSGSHQHSPYGHCVLPREALSVAGRSHFFSDPADTNVLPHQEQDEMGTAWTAPAPSFTTPEPPQETMIFVERRGQSFFGEKPMEKPKQQKMSTEEAVAPASSSFAAAGAGRGSPFASRGRQLSEQTFGSMSSGHSFTAIPRHRVSPVATNTSSEASTPRPSPWTDHTTAIPAVSSHIPPPQNQSSVFTVTHPQLRDWGLPFLGFPVALMEQFVSLREPPRPAASAPNTRLFFGQLPLELPTHALRWLVQQLSGVDTLRFDSRGFGCYLGYFRTEAEAHHVMATLHEQVLFDTHGVWFARNEAELAVLRAYQPCLIHRPNYHLPRHMMTVRTETPRAVRRAAKAATANILPDNNIH